MTLKKFIAITITIMFLLVSCVFFNADTEDLNDNFETNKPETMDYCDAVSSDEIAPGSRELEGTRNARVPMENNAHGGCWVDSFEDDSGIGTGTNYVQDDSNISLTKNSSEFIDNYNGADGTAITSYDSNYNWGASGSTGTRYVELDTAQKYEGASSVLLHVSSSSKYGLWFNKSISYTIPRIEVNCYIRIFTGPSSHPNRVGCAYHFALESNDDDVTFIDFYNGAIRYRDGGSTIDSGKTVTHNTWYKINIILYKNKGVYSNYDYSLWNTNNMMNPIFSKSGIAVSTGGYSLIDKFRVRIANVWDRQNTNGWFDALSINETDYDDFGYIQSKPISIPDGMDWDTLITSKTQPTDTFLNITLLNALNDQPIPGTPKYIVNGEFDISYIEPAVYSTIKLKANFEISVENTPILHYWGVCWNASNAWQDTMFGGFKVGSRNAVDVIDGEAQFTDTATLRSKPINIPEMCYYDTLIVDKTVALDIPILVSVLDAQTNYEILGFYNLADTEIDLSGLDPIMYPAIKLQATTDYSNDPNPTLYDWSINWTRNIGPKIVDIFSS